MNLVDNVGMCCSGYISSGDQLYVMSSVSRVKNVIPPKNPSDLGYVHLVFKSENV